MKTKVVFEILYTVADDHPMAHGGPAGDGSFVERFRKRADAEKFAKTKTFHGKPSQVRETEVSAMLARRWGF
ncbi:MAG: hypothetical protein IPG93_24565 [Burkholderiales bacterium]|nr:hypothetical protein [Burkholderiales bacterium]